MLRVEKGFVKRSAFFPKKSVPQMHTIKEPSKELPSHMNACFQCILRFAFFPVVL